MGVFKDIFVFIDIFGASSPCSELKITMTLPSLSMAKQSVCISTDVPDQMRVSGADKEAEEAQGVSVCVCVHTTPRLPV